MKGMDELWQEVAIGLGNQIYQSVNTADMVGTDDETGYILMFFNTRNHGGKTTLVSSTTNRVELKKLLKTALRELDGPKAKIVDRGKYEN